MSSEVTIVNCPTCGKQVAWTTENQYRPFCSERCKLIDLGAWANEDYNLPAQEEEPLSDLIRH
ncbi:MULTISPECIES: DNA gyrase inhibitor YacG [Neisseria]|uniref:DNA gyrase inhibitor YacG n=1 Tax=Neisseria animaloris TaxID=326522 RepID=A0A1X3CHZ7_9NEIS|nr:MULTISPECIES: DNA gyrase inhibitor YacG [Neisseria]MDO1509573.1 DNA gyrase inhibitor YacG [Neisseria sp. MVDL19-042950]MDO1515655.1 DNA gyrase inhibitor YacG [Neisseria sp. MVDL18-041461]MDO1564080.1 DNA gyrase inhibitor YacG [Neisseria sp. MVDL20-010259]OSI06887.1 DNA gyrase inhibitor YacG [Neisseria animaloris]VEH88110.1 zinc-binding protein YacG [Neisseria animaloris]